MHPTTLCQLATAQIAGLHHHAARERMAQAALLGRRAQPHHRTRLVPGHAATVLARVLTLADGHRPSPTR